MSSSLGLRVPEAPCSPGHREAEPTGTGVFSPCPGAGHLRAARLRPASSRAPAPDAGSPLPPTVRQPCPAGWRWDICPGFLWAGDSEQFAPPCAQVDRFQPQGPAPFHTGNLPARSGVGADPEPAACSVFLATSVRPKGQQVRSWLQATRDPAAPPSCLRWRRPSHRQILAHPPLIPGLTLRGVVRQGGCAGRRRTEEGRKGSRGPRGAQSHTQLILAPKTPQHKICPLVPGMPRGGAGRRVGVRGRGVLPG